MTFATKLQEVQKAAHKQGREEERINIILKLAKKFPVEEIAAMLEESVEYIQETLDNH